MLLVWEPHVENHCASPHCCLAWIWFCPDSSAHPERIPLCCYLASQTSLSVATRYDACSLKEIYWLFDALEFTNLPSAQSPGKSLTVIALPEMSSPDLQPAQRGQIPHINAQYNSQWPKSDILQGTSQMSPPPRTPHLAVTSPFHTHTPYLDQPTGSLLCWAPGNWAAVASTLV
jgi:hypothetical protein